MTGGLRADYISYDNGQVGSVGNFSLALADSLPVVKIPNYSFKNMGNANFKNTSSIIGNFSKII